MSTHFQPNSEKRKLGLPLSSLAVLSILLISGFLAVPRAFAFANGENASIVIGQPDFNSSYKIAPQVNQSRLSSPYNVKFDSTGNLWVADSADSRVLEFKPSFSNGMSASLVLGQPNLTADLFGTTSASVLQTPEGMAFDSSGNLWVSDTAVSRILEFKTPFSNGENASVVLGASDFTTNPSTDTASQSNLNAPIGMAFDSSGNLWVADTGYQRVLEFKTPFSNGESASTVLGQDNFTAKSLPNEPGCPPTCNSPTKATLDDPSDVAFDSSGNLWVADRSDWRIVEFTPPFTNGQAANTIVGGPCAIFGQVLTANCNGVIEFIAFDHSGMLWASDTGNGRILGYPSPLTAGENATVVLGQPDFVTGISVGILNATQSNLGTPEGMAFDSSGNLWVADGSGLDRVLMFPAATTATSAASSSAQTSTVTSSVAGPTGGSTSSVSASGNQATSSSKLAPVTTTTSAAKSSGSSSSSLAISLSFVEIILIFLGVAGSVAVFSPRVKK